MNEQKSTSFWDLDENREPFPIKECLKLNNAAISGGWFTVTVVCENVVRHVTASYLCEPLDTMIEKMMNLIWEFESDVHGYSHEYQYDMDWVEEPGLTQWRFRGHEDRTVDVVLEDDSEGTKKEIFRGRMKADELMNAVYGMAVHILQQYGLAGYREAWMSREFPLGPFIQLHNRVTGEKNQIKSLEQDLAFLARFLPRPHADLRSFHGS